MNSNIFAAGGRSGFAALAEKVLILGIGVEREGGGKGTRGGALLK